MADNRRQLEMRWIAVTDERGRTHMETVWINTATPVITAHVSTAHVSTAHVSTAPVSTAHAA